MDIIQNMIDICTKLISSGGLFFGFFLVLLESFLPILPLSVFVALNVNAFGFIPGVIISWIATCVGSFLCYFIFSCLEEKLLSKVIHGKRLIKIRDTIDKFEMIQFSQLVLIFTLPFTPSFLINIVSGLSGISKEKFLMSLLIGKMFAIIFWGYIGRSLIESLTDVYSLLYITITLVIAYILSNIVEKKMNIK